MTITLKDLNHRQLATKMRTDLTALERNLDILHMTGNDEGTIYKAQLETIAKQIENLTTKTWEMASNAVVNDMDNKLNKLISRTPLLPTEPGQFK